MTTLLYKIRPAFIMAAEPLKITAINRMTQKVSVKVKNRDCLLSRRGNFRLVRYIMQARLSLAMFWGGPYSKVWRSIASIYQGAAHLILCYSQEEVGHTPETLGGEHNNEMYSAVQVNVHISNRDGSHAFPSFSSSTSHIWTTRQILTYHFLSLQRQSHVWLQLGQ